MEDSKKFDSLCKLIWDLESGHEHYCVDCGEDTSSGRQYHKEDCKLKEVIDLFAIPKEPY